MLATSDAHSFDHFQPAFLKNNLPCQSFSGFQRSRSSCCTCGARMRRTTVRGASAAACDRAACSSLSSYVLCLTHLWFALNLCLEPGTSLGKLRVSISCNEAGSLGSFDVVPAFAFRNSAFQMTLQLGLPAIPELAAVVVMNR